MGQTSRPAHPAGDAHVTETTYPASRGPSTGWGIFARHGTSKAVKKLGRPGETPRTLASCSYCIKKYNIINNWLKIAYFSLNTSRISLEI
jgi:hypothetical protein